MNFNSQLSTSGHEPWTCDTPVSHSIDIPTEELKSIAIIGTLSFLTQYPLTTEHYLDSICNGTWKYSSFKSIKNIQSPFLMKTNTDVKVSTLSFVSLTKLFSGDKTITGHQPPEAFLTRKIPLWKDRRLYETIYGYFQQQTELSYLCHMSSLLSSC